MPEYLAPGVYVEERAGQRSIEGVPTSTVGFVGMTERGPTEGPPVLVTSFGEFQRRYGGFLPFIPATAGGEHGHLPLAVKHFFDNGGTRAFVARAFQSRPDQVIGATTIAVDFRTLQLATGVAARLRSNASVESGAAPPPAQRISVATLRGYGYGALATPTLHREIGAPATSAINAGFPASSQVQIDPGLTAANGTHRSDTAFVLLQPVTAGAGPRLTAVEPGVWAEKLRVQIRAVQLPPTRLTAIAGTALQVASASSFYRGCTIELRRSQPNGQLQDVAYATVTAIVGNTLTIVAPAIALPAYALATDTVEVSVAEIEIALEWGAMVETYRGSWRYMTVLNAPGYTTEERDDFNRRRSAWGVLVRRESRLCAATESDITPDYTENDPLDSHPTTANGQPAALMPWAGLPTPLPAGQPDLPPTIPDYLGNAAAGPGQRSAIAALADEETISLVAVPGISDSVVQGALITHAENLRFRFAVLDGPRTGDIAGIREHRGNFDSKYAAIYYPWVESTSPVNGSTIWVPPSGITLGIYGRSDTQRGVHKAPANEVVRSAQRPVVKVSHGEQEVLNPEGINVIRDFREVKRGVRVWGARTISSDPEWKYVNVRRLFIYLEHSIFKSTQWVVFEPNNDALWAAVRRTIETFLENEWRKGALFGAKATDAFFVKCDRSTMSQLDIDNGRLICEIGVAPTKPAEFVIFRIGQYTADRPS